MHLQAAQRAAGDHGRQGLRLGRRQGLGERRLHVLLGKSCFSTLQGTCMRGWEEAKKDILAEKKIPKTNRQDVGMNLMVNLSSHGQGGEGH